MTKILDIGQIMAIMITAGIPETRVRRGLMEPTIHSKIRYFHELMQEMGVLKSHTRALKNNANSKKYRESGNKMFTQGLKGMYTAIRMYNQAICWAEPNNGDDLAISYANRSAVLFEWKEYQLCRDNIKLAKDNGYPERLMKKLNDRDNECVRMLIAPKMKKNEKPLKFSLSCDHTSATSFPTDVPPMYSYDKYRLEPNLSLMPNPSIPFAANCLEIKYNAVVGRYIVTNEDLKPGQIVVIENPYVHADLTLKDDLYRYTKCGNCYEENVLSLIPCMSCSTMMFCSEKCLNESREFHDIECSISDYMSPNYLFCDPTGQIKAKGWVDTLPLRMILKAYRSFDSTSLLNKFCKTHNESEGYSLSYDDDMSDEEKYRQIYGLESKMEYSLEDYCQAAFFYNTLVHKTKFGEVIKTEEDHNTLLELIIHHVRIVKRKAIGCCEYKEFDMSDAGDDKSVAMYSRGIYPFSSSFQHSCAPNISTIAIGTKMIVYCSRVIKKGSQLLRSYGNCHYFQHHKSKRQQMLYEMFSIRCKCEGCTKNYPANYENIAEGNLPSKYDVLLGIHTTMLDVDIENFEEYLKILEKFDKKLPCLSLNALQLRVHKIMKLKYGTISTNLKMAFKFHPLAVALNE